jgi:signal transduction histidine kinase
MESPDKIIARCMRWLEGFPKPAIVGLTFGIFIFVAWVDDITGFEINCTVFYLLAIGMATWYLGVPFGLFMSLLSTLFTTFINTWNGQRYTSHVAPYWNASIVLSFYLIVVWLLRSLRVKQDTLEQRVEERTATLTMELTERKRLEKEILVISEREQQRIGRDIHDSLCQHLTGTALAEQYLVAKLSDRAAEEVEDAERVVVLIEDAISMARGMAAGMSPIEMGGEGLVTGLADLARYFSAQFKVACRFECWEPVTVESGEVATHLYRIAQEAMHNAIRHGKARNIVILLGLEGGRQVLMVSDDGTGLPGEARILQGMGLRNMKYRASMIGGSLNIENGERGAIVTCTFPGGGSQPN